MKKYQQYFLVVIYILVIYQDIKLVKQSQVAHQMRLVLYRDLIQQTIDLLSEDQVQTQVPFKQEKILQVGHQQL